VLPSHRKGARPAVLNTARPPCGCYPTEGPPLVRQSRDHPGPNQSVSPRIADFIDHSPAHFYTDHVVSLGICILVVAVSRGECEISRSSRSGLAVYENTAPFPGDERFGLTIQLRRATVSIPSNIAEGWGRTEDRELAHFLSLAAGSACEVEYQLDLFHSSRKSLMRQARGFVGISSALWRRIVYPRVGLYGRPFLLAECCSFVV
jgi:four helix bundle protein